MQGSERVTPGSFVGAGLMMGLCLQHKYNKLTPTHWRRRHIGQENVRARSIPNELVPNPELPTFERFERFVQMITKVPGAEADKVSSGSKRNKVRGAKD